jgi:hypothetical protein
VTKGSALSTYSRLLPASCSHCHEVRALRWAASRACSPRAWHSDAAAILLPPAVPWLASDWRVFQVCCVFHTLLRKQTVRTLPTAASEAVLSRSLASIGTHRAASLAPLPALCYAGPTEAPGPPQLLSTTRWGLQLAMVGAVLIRPPCPRGMGVPIDGAPTRRLILALIVSRRRGTR